MHTLHTVLMAAAAPPNINPVTMLAKIKALVIIAIGVLLFVISGMAIWEKRRGDPKGAASMVATIVICMIPAGIAVSYGVAVFAPGTVSWIF